MDYTITYWMYKKFLISNCRGLKKLKFFHSFKSIKMDMKTYPHGRLVTIKIK